MTMRDAVFDLDGTIVDSAVQCAAIGRAMRADRGGGDLSLDAVKRLSSQGGRILVAGMLGVLADCPDADLAEFRTRYAAMPTPATCLYPGIRAALVALHAQGVRLSICSAKPQALCERVLADVGLTPMFAAIVGSDPLRPCKPDARHFDHLRDRLPGLRAACYIGDSEVDAAFADAVGIPIVMVSHGYAIDGFDFASRPTAPDVAAIPAMVLALLSDAAAQ